jgi:hypothetical protein
VQQRKNDNGIGVELLWVFLPQAEARHFPGTAQDQPSRDEEVDAPSLEELIEAVLAGQADR